MGAFSTLEIKLIGALVALVGLFGLAMYLEHRGAEKCVMDNAQVALIQKAAAKAQEALDAARVKDAEDDLQVEIAANAALRASLPTDHVVCYSPSPQRVPTTAKVPAPRAPGTGVLPQPRPPDPVAFDPGPQLDTLFDKADDILARCRELDNAVPH